MTHADVTGWVTGLSAHGLAPASVRQAHRVLSLVLSLAVRDGRIPRNPADKVRLPRASKPEKRFLSDSEVEALAEAAGDHGLAIRILASLGLRFGELAALRVGRVDLLRRRLEISGERDGGQGQGGVRHNEDACDEIRADRPTLVDALANHVAGRGREELVFRAPRGGVLLLRNWRRQVFDPAARSAGLDGLTPHELRHTAASLAVSSGANVLAVQRLLGHASAAMTLDVYSGSLRRRSRRRCRAHG